MKKIRSTTETEKKLKEAEFFLKNTKKHVKDFEKFSYFLNAFVSSARSVTWIMRAEFGDNPKWIEWWENRHPNDEDADILRLFTNLRNDSQKKRSIGTGFAMTLNVKINKNEEIVLLKNLFKNPKRYTITITQTRKNKKKTFDKGIHIENKEGGNRLTIPEATVEKIDPIFNFSSDKSYEAIKACEKYYLILKRLVNEWINLGSTE